MKKFAYLTAALALSAGMVVAQEKSAAKGDAEKGKAVFEQCGACHNTDTDEKKMGPSLMGLSKRAKLQNGKANNEANLRAILNNGGNGMPAYADLLTDEEKADVLAYIRTL
ncbi:MAG TPA: c-type cytochrome [Bryobacteraceae bacterium]|nr:c-type cytochrome [Bryobacteraceae bacterium]